MLKRDLFKNLETDTFTNTFTNTNEKHHTIWIAECHYQDDCQNVNCADGGNDTGNVNPVSVAALINTGKC